MFFSASRLTLAITSRTAYKRRPLKQVVASATHTALTPPRPVAGESESESELEGESDNVADLLRKLVFTSANVSRSRAPSLSASERVLVARVVGADQSLRGDVRYLNLLRQVDGDADLSAAELDVFQESVLRRSTQPQRARAHAEALVVLLLQSRDVAHHERALTWLRDALAFKLHSSRTFHRLVALLLGADAPTPLTAARRAILDGVLAANFPEHADLFFPDYDWRDTVLLLAARAEFDWLVKIVDLWFAHVPSPALIQERFFSRVLSLLARAQRGDIAELLVQRLRGRVMLTSTTHGVMIQVWGRAGRLDKARQWYQSGIALPQRNVVFYVQAIDAEAFLGTWASVKDVLDAMMREVPEAEMAPNVYSTVLEAMLRQRDFSELEKWYSLAQARGRVDEKLMVRYTACVRMARRIGAGDAAAAAAAAVASGGAATKQGAANIE